MEEGVSPGCSWGRASVSGAGAPAGGRVGHPDSPGCASERQGAYVPRHPEQSILYAVVARHLETFLAQQQEEGRSVPHFVERELREYLNCGQLPYGFLRLACQSCGREKLVPLSCKGRAVCPSCCGRRMVDTAAHLVDRVFPHVPVRQWVLSLPFALRYRLAYDAGMVTAVLQVFLRALFGFYRRLARDYGIDQTQCGAVTFVQRFGSSANANLHFHTICMDGVYAPGRDGKPEFFALRALENSEVAELVHLAAQRISALLKRRGGGQHSDAEDSDRLARQEPWLSDVYAASVCGRVATGSNAGRRIRLGDRIDPESLDILSSPRCASAEGFSLHGNVSIAARDRARLERLIRYTARPPLAIERLEGLPNGKLRYWFKTPWRDGTTHAVFEPAEFLEKLCALVPTPRAHLVRYHGVLGPAAAWRPLVVPNGGGAIQTAPEPPPVPEDIAAGGGSPPDPIPASHTETPVKDHPRNYTWSELLRRVWASDVLSCEACGGRLRLVATIRAPEVIHKILEHLGLPSRAPPVTPAALQRLPFASS